MKLSIIGTGYVGRVTGTGFASLDNDVICMDVGAEKIDRLSRGILTIYEPGLEEVFKRNLKSGRLTFTTDVAASIRSSDIIFIRIGTPCDPLQSTDLRV